LSQRRESSEVDLGVDGSRVNAFVPENTSDFNEGGSPAKQLTGEGVPELMCSPSERFHSRASKRVFYYITHGPVILESAKGGVYAEKQTPGGNLLPPRAKISGNRFADVGW
jgi:hypothetical protein